MLLSRDAIASAVEVCSAEDFYKPAHSHTFDAICSLYSQGEPADPVTVADELRRANLLEAAGGPSALVTLQANTPSTGNAARYARIIEEHALLRRLIGVAGEIAEDCYDLPEDVVATVDRAESRVFEVAQRRVTDTLRPIRDLLSDSLDRLEALYDRGESITGVPTGYVDLDERLSGLQPSNLIVVGARPSAGKTSFALGMAAHAALEAGKAVLIFSLEMSHLEITQRLLCAEAKVDASRMRNGRLLDTDWPKISPSS
jgi:replicative DNA helicase